MKFVLALALMAGAQASLLRGTTTTDACTNDADKAIWDANTDNFEDMMSTCGTKCLGRSSCVTSCVQDAEGYSSTCAGCFGELAGCTASSCWSKCINSASDDCKTCVISNCDPAFATCSGVAEDDIPKAVAPAAAASAGPAGTYTGSKTVLGETIGATIVVSDDQTTFDIELTGIISLDCDAEAYTYDGDSTITITHIGESGDCAHDALSDNGVTYKSTAYDASADQITVTVKYGVLTVAIELAHANSRLALLHAQALLALAAAAPAGTYSGSKTVLGETIGATIVTNDDATMNIELSGVIALDCENEAYTYDSGVIAITDIDQSGDCAHDALSDNGVTFKSATYDASADTITVTVKYSLLTVAIELDHAASSKLARAYARSALALAATEPAGTYSGSKTVLGETIDATITVNADSTCDIVLSDLIALDCENEAYTYDSGVITITNIGESGDCAHDALSDNGVTFKSATYDASADTITVTVKYSLLTVAIELEKQSM